MLTREKEIIDKNKTEEGKKSEGLTFKGNTEKSENKSSKSKKIGTGFGSPYPFVKDIFGVRNRALYVFFSVVDLLKDALALIDSRKKVKFGNIQFDATQEVIISFIDLTSFANLETSLLQMSLLIKAVAEVRRSYSDDELRKMTGIRDENVTLLLTTVKQMYVRLCISDLLSFKSNLINPEDLWTPAAQQLTRELLFATLPNAKSMRLKDEVLSDDQRLANLYSLYSEVLSLRSSYDLGRVVGRLRVLNIVEAFLTTPALLMEFFREGIDAGSPAFRSEKRANTLTRFSDFLIYVLTLPELSDALLKHKLLKEADHLGILRMQDLPEKQFEELLKVDYWNLQRDVCSLFEPFLDASASCNDLGLNVTPVPLDLYTTILGVDLFPQEFIDYQKTCDTDLPWLSVSKYGFDLTGLQRSDVILQPAFHSLTKFANLLRDNQTRESFKATRFLPDRDKFINLRLAYRSQIYESLELVNRCLYGIQTEGIASDLKNLINFEHVRLFPQTYLFYSNEESYPVRISDCTSNIPIDSKRAVLSLHNMIISRMLDLDFFPAIAYNFHSLNYNSKWRVDSKLVSAFNHSVLPYYSGESFYPAQLLEGSDTNFQEVISVDELAHAGYIRVDDMSTYNFKVTISRMLRMNLTDFNDMLIDADTLLELATLLSGVMGIFVVSDDTLLSLAEPSSVTLNDMKQASTPGSVKELKLSTSTSRTSLVGGCITPYAGAYGYDTKDWAFMASQNILGGFYDIRSKILFTLFKHVPIPEVPWIIKEYNRLGFGYVSFSHAVDEKDKGSMMKWIALGPMFTNYGSLGPIKIGQFNTAPVVFDGLNGYSTHVAYLSNDNRVNLPTKCAIAGVPSGISYTNFEGYNPLNVPLTAINIVKAIDQAQSEDVTNDLSNSFKSKLEQEEVKLKQNIISTTKSANSQEDTIESLGQQQNSITIGESRRDSVNEDVHSRVENEELGKKDNLPLGEVTNKKKKGSNINNEMSDHTKSPMNKDDSDPHNRS